MKWVRVEDYHFNADHIMEIRWSCGKLFIWDDGVPADNVIENVCPFDDPDRRKYLSLCDQLGILPIQEDE